MKKIFFIISILIFSSAIITGLTGCHKDKGCKEWKQTTIELQELQNITWKCVGFVNTKSCNIKELKYDKKEEDIYRERCYTLMFTEDKMLGGIGYSNSLCGNYEIDTITCTINLSVGTLTMLGLVYDEGLFIESLNKVQLFSIRGNELRLYYNNNKNYLLFKRQ